MPHECVTFVKENNHRWPLMTRCKFFLYGMYFFLLLTTGGMSGCTAQNGQQGRAGDKGDSLMNISEDEWKQRLSPEQYEVLRNKATERPFSGKYVNTTAEGIYVCAGCGAELFSSADKFDAGCGWPSFSAALAEGRIIERTDRSHGMVRTEIICARCGGHLGHVFDDGPLPTGLRYCVNSVSLDFRPAAETPDKPGH